MRILVLGADTPIGYSLRAFIPPLQRHELVLLPLEASRWSRLRQAKKALKTADPDLVVDARLISQLDDPDGINELDMERTQWLGEFAQKQELRYMLLSSSRVFSGSLLRPYRESDSPDSIQADGRALIDAETMLSALIEPLFILRLGWVFSGRGPSVFKFMLDRLREKKTLAANDQRKDCPVHTAEVARVVAGVIDQISVGAPARGLYHYGSEGDTGYFAFCEALVAYASQFEVFADATELLKELPAEDGLNLNRSLDCTAIRHQFGVQRRPWRDFVERAVRRYVELYCEEMTV